MQDPITARAAAASSAVTRFTTHPMLASLQPLIREWLLAVQAKIGAHRQDEQPWWASTNNLAEEFVASAKRIGWHAGLVPTRDSGQAWDIRLDEPDGGPRYVACAIGLLLSMSDNADAMEVLERGLAHAKASATEFPLEHGRERLVLAFAIPYRPTGDDPNDDFARQVDTWLARFPFVAPLQASTADACVLVRSEPPRNASGWVFPGVGVIVDMIPTQLQLGGTKPFHQPSTKRQARMSRMKGATPAGAKTIRATNEQGFMNLCELALHILTTRPRNAATTYAVRQIIREASLKAAKMDGTRAHFITAKALHYRALGQNERTIREHIVPISEALRPTRDKVPSLEELVTAAMKSRLVAIITKEEDALLTKEGLKTNMPNDWDEEDPFARYSRVGIELKPTPDHIKR